MGFISVWFVVDLFCIGLVCSIKLPCYFFELWCLCTFGLKKKPPKVLFCSESTRNSRRLIGSESPHDGYFIFCISLKLPSTVSHTETYGWRIFLHSVWKRMDCPVGLLNFISQSTFFNQLFFIACKNKSCFFLDSILSWSCCLGVVAPQWKSVALLLTPHSVTLCRYQAWLQGYTVTPPWLIWSHVPAPDTNISTQEPLTGWCSPQHIQPVPVAVLDPTLPDVLHNYFSANKTITSSPINYPSLALTPIIMKCNEGDLEVFPLKNVLLLSRNSHEATSRVNA